MNAVSILIPCNKGWALGRESDIVIGERTTLLMPDGNIIHTSPVVKWSNYHGDDLFIVTKSGSTYYIART